VKRRAAVSARRKHKILNCVLSCKDDSTAHVGTYGTSAPHTAKLRTLRKEDIMAL